VPIFGHDEQHLRPLTVAIGQARKHRALSPDELRKIEAQRRASG
jgi:hypothetical protein